MKMKVIVAIDRSQYWQQVIEAVVKRSWAEGTAFKILTVIEPAQWEHVGFVEERNETKEIAAARRLVAEETVEQAQKLIEKALPDCSVTTEIKRGNARSEILGEAVHWMADKIVVGAHGLSSNRLLPGTVSQAVARHSPCSIDLVRLAPSSHPISGRDLKIKNAS